MVFRHVWFINCYLKNITKDRKKQKRHLNETYNKMINVNKF